MPGIFGLASHRCAAAPSEILTAMAGRMLHHPWYKVERHIEPSGRVALGRVSAGIVNTSVQPAANEDGCVTAVMDGEVYDYESFRGRLEADGYRFAGNSQAELLIHGYEAHGPTFFGELHGKFSSAIWDARSRRLILVNDRFGMKPLYYTQNSGRLLFASSLQALLADRAVNRQIDLRGLSQFLTFGQLLGEDTMVDGVRLLPAAGYLTYETDADRCTLNRYWRLESRPTVCSTAETLERIDAAFQQAVSRTTANTDGLGLSLSGGMDARTILALVAQPGQSVTTLTSGMEGNMDQRSAVVMARQTGSAHHEVILDHAFLANFESHLRGMVRLTDGQYLCQCIVMPTLPVYRELGIRVLLRGHAGELMHMGKAYSFSVDQEALAIADQSRLMNWLWRHLQAHMLNGVPGRLLARANRWETESLANQSLRSCLDDTATTQPLAHRIWHLFLNQRLRRETALSMVEFDSVVETRLPYLDNELVDELFAAPPELKLGDTIQDHILRRHRPSFRHIVNVNTGTVVGAGPLRRKVASFRTRVFAKLGVKGYQPYERLGLWLRREIRPLVQSLLLSDRCLDRGIFDPETVRAVVNNHLHNRRNHTYLLLAMMIVEMAQREFVDDEINVEQPSSEQLVEAGAA